MQKFITYEPAELKALIREAIAEHELQKEKTLTEKLFTVNQARKLLGRAHHTVKKLCQDGVIRTTKSGMIPESALYEYLNIEP